MYSYNIHGIISVVSDAWLPELQRFRVEEPIAQPTLRVRIGRLKRSGNRQPVADGVRQMTYDEGMGPLGFGIDIAIGERIEVLASPILRYSPHVLYTNVVEPILRWTFVEKGYALVHGACIAFGEEAFLVTARTDTGKTTTMLRILDQQRRATDTVAFMSDDLTLVAPDGQVLTYPKPLTISQHTVAAINAPLLSRRERLSLQWQSRLHSRGGRKVALDLSKSRLPVATLNTVVQLLVPPPKYHVQRLVPHVKVTQSARLAGLFIIERGGEGELRLGSAEGLDILMANCDDAYGFPPYHTIKGFLHGTNDLDLRAVERDIVAAAFQGLPMTLIRSSKMDWAQRIPALAQAVLAHEAVGEQREEVLLEREVGAPMTMGLSAT